MVKKVCPACKSKLSFEPWKDDLASFEICPKCGIQFGYDDFAGRDKTLRLKIYKLWSDEWVKNRKKPINNVQFFEKYKLFNITKDNFISELLKEVPEFKPVHEEQREYHEIGINLVFGDLKRLAEKAVEKNNGDLLRRIASFVLNCYKSDKEFQNAVFVSFFENMSKKSIKAISQYLPKEPVNEVNEFLKEFDEKTHNIRKYREVWKKASFHLEKAYCLLPKNFIDVKSNNGEFCGSKAFKEYLEHNELELTLKELEHLGELNKVSQDFWKELQKAAKLMNLPRKNYPSSSQNHKPSKKN